MQSQFETAEHHETQRHERREATTRFVREKPWVPAEAEAEIRRRVACGEHASADDVRERGNAAHVVFLMISKANAKAETDFRRVEE